MVTEVFPAPVTDLPQAEIPLQGVTAYLLQAKNHQVIFMQFAEDVNVPEHFHESQWEIVLEGRVELSIDGARRTYSKGDRFFIPKGVKHSARVFAGYTAFGFFNQADRYKVKPG
jgi:quercetin dioxygenase-like cupin family protein